MFLESIVWRHQLQGEAFGNIQMQSVAGTTLLLQITILCYCLTVIWKIPFQAQYESKREEPVVYSL